MRARLYTTKILLQENGCLFFMYFGPIHTTRRYRMVQMNVGRKLSSRNHPLTRGSEKSRAKIGIFSPVSAGSFQLTTLLSQIYRARHWRVSNITVRDVQSNGMREKKFEQNLVLYGSRNVILCNTVL